MTFPVLHDTVARHAEHARPLFPSVHRLLLEHTVTNLEDIKGTGVRGMLTKGDVLTFLGKASNPLGTFKFGLSPIEEALKLVENKKDVVPVRHIFSPSYLKTCF
jgi:pyruvate/2-oxoglutarate dehydrogenase complex dihydrolipoamide acyltransferase (E2) component